MEVEVCVEREGEKEREEKEKSFPKSIKKRIKNQAKINQKSSKKKPKIYQKINQKSILEGYQGVLGGSWQPIPKNEECDLFFGTLLGPSWRPLGPSWRPLGAVLAVLAASWAVLGRLQIDVKIDQKFDVSWDRFSLRFGWILGRKMNPSWYQNGIQQGIP